MPTINKKSSIMTKSRTKKSYMTSVSSYAPRERSFNKCRTPTKNGMRNLDREFKVTPVRRRRRIDADQLMSNFNNTHVSNTKKILKHGGST